MKNIKYIIGLFLFSTLVFTSCEKVVDKEFGDIVAPSNIQITAEIVGQDEANPFGDGSGDVNFTVIASNVITYKFIKDGSGSLAPFGTKSYSFVAAKGPVGTFDVEKYTVTAVAIGVGGISSSASIEVEVLAPNVPPPVIIEDFEGDVLPTLEAFGGDGVIVEYVVNPYKSGINTSESVIQFTKGSGSETWAGLVVPSDNIDMVIYSKTALKIWSPKAGMPVLFKFETSAGNGGPVFEVETNTSLSETWEEIIFDFSDAPNEAWTRIVIFCDWNSSGDDSVYYIDDVKLLN